MSTTPTVEVREHEGAFDCWVLNAGGVETCLSTGYATQEEAWDFFARLRQGIEAGLFPGD